MIVFLGEKVIWDLLNVIIITRCSFDFFLGHRLRLSVLKLFAPNTNVRFEINISETFILLAIENLSDFKG